MRFRKYYNIFIYLLIYFRYYRYRINRPSVYIIVVNNYYYIAYKNFCYYKYLINRKAVITFNLFSEKNAFTFSLIIYKDYRGMILILLKIDNLYCCY